MPQDTPYRPFLYHLGFTFTSDSRFLIVKTKMPSLLGPDFKLIPLWKNNRYIETMYFKLKIYNGISTFFLCLYITCMFVTLLFLLINNTVFLLINNTVFLQYFLENYAVLMEGSSNNPNDFGSNNGGGGFGFNSDPGGGPGGDNTIFAGIKRKFNDSDNNDNINEPLPNRILRPRIDGPDSHRSISSDLNTSVPRSNILSALETSINSNRLAPIYPNAYGNTTLPTYANIYGHITSNTSTQDSAYWGAPSTIPAYHINPVDVVDNTSYNGNDTPLTRATFPGWGNIRTMLHMESVIDTSTKTATEWAYDNKGEEHVTEYKISDTTNACECCKNRGIDHCTCGGPRSVGGQPVRTMLAPNQVGCEDKDGYASGLPSRAMNCCGCGRRMYNYVCTKCLCIFCKTCHIN